MEDMPPGFRFYPTEEELVSFYLHNKLEGSRQDLDRVIPVVDIYDFNPWHLPQFAGERCQGDPEQWFFFIPRQEREMRGGRPNRLTNSGYWKATGSPGYVYSSGNRVIGVKKTMVFYQGRAPSGRKTQWKMNEYKAIEGETNPSTGAIPMLRHEFSLCRVYKKSKCVRAFDRRPPSGVVIREARAQQAHADEATISNNQNHPTVEKKGSPESSSSGYQHGLPSQTGESSTNWEMDVDNIDPLWEWEQLNWI